uniref:Uncharacterized protein n=1 Tax=Oreochromis niloticus TaxID=8128 RepID=A0A669EVP9_ORENI
SLPAEFKLVPGLREYLFNTIKTLSCVKVVACWAHNWISNKNSTFTAVEGIFSSCFIFWLKKRGLMLGLTFSNELIGRDEGRRCPLCWPHWFMLPLMGLLVCLIGMNCDVVMQYIEFVADRLPLELLQGNTGQGTGIQFEGGINFKTSLYPHNIKKFLHLCVWSEAVEQTK